jgi:hypothetical protein
MNAQHPVGSVPAADPPDDLAALLNTLADGNLSDAEELRLRAILEGSPAARQAFREFATLHAGLYWDYASLLAPALPPLSETRPDGEGPGHSLRRTAAMLAAAAMAVAAGVAMWLFLIPPARPLVAQGLATVTNARFLLPSNPTNSLADGQSLAAGRVALLGGGIELTLTNGGAHKLWWSNADASASREVNDEPTEARLYPGSCGQAIFAPNGGNWGKAEVE